MAYTPQQQFNQQQFPFDAGNDIPDWKFPMRHEMQEVITGLFLGPLDCAKKKQKLDEKGITHILCIRGKGEEPFVKEFHPGQYHYRVIEVSESPLQALIPFFPSAKDFCDEALQAGGRVLVHCNNGVSRSPAFVVAYVMETLKVTYEEAFNLVQTRRFCMDPLHEFKVQLKEYEFIFKARKSISDMNYTDEQILFQGQRRRKEPDDMDDDEMFDDGVTMDEAE
ncbi:serine/threonine/tyrosine-interacting protein-like protein [Cladochytrium replicatum]|nr:serine/threonine/tyrosine-interacting protein-like protein [Cladochytrium replicatum]